MSKPLAFAVLAAVFSMPAMAQPPGKDDTVIKPSAQSGLASIYSHKSGRTASGEPSNPKNLTAAHRSLPFGTMVRVTNPKNGSSVVVRINDRGPFHMKRIIDITPVAARQLGFSGLAPVRLEVVSR